MPAGSPASSTISRARLGLPRSGTTTPKAIASTRRASTAWRSRRPSTACFASARGPRLANALPERTNGVRVPAMIATRSIRVPPASLGRAGLGASRRDPLVGARPARIERLPGLIHVHHHRRVVGGQRLALARLAIDLGPDDSRRERSRRQQMIDAHPLVLVEVTRAIVPPRVTVRLRVVQTIDVHQPPFDQTGERPPLALGDVRPAVRGLAVP